ncbi:unnamed protein product [Microthlaspi erraticum]|uniref:Retrotransposon gag domain-containing protein n=1 Tax=Microthlaspi erraticum TaxID=1685480 RepID=A0A6D2JVR8_9BRAS|nr:unnamed protein product [Microthlaspi erraticum]
MESVIQWRSKAEEKALETNRTVAKLSNLVETMMKMMQARFQAEDDGVAQIRPTSTHGPQVNTDFSEPGPSETQLGPRNIGSVLPSRDSMLRKVEMPIFDGKNPHSWIARIEMFFRQYQEDQKLELISLSTEGEVLSWFNWEDKRMPFFIWTEFKKRLLVRFGNPERNTPKQSLASIKQLASVADYVHEFEELSSLISGVAEEMLEAIFVDGFKPEMREIVRLKEPRDLSHMIATILQMEDGLLCRAMANKRVTEVKSGPTDTALPSRNSSTNLGGNWKTKPALLEPGQSVAKQNPKEQESKLPYNWKLKRHLTQAEFEWRKKNKLCFKCDEKYFYGHACVNKELQVMTVINGFDVELLEEEFYDAIEDEKEDKPTCMTLSLNAFLGISSPTTTKVRGDVGRVSIVVMMDSRATHNFISPSLVKKAHLKTQQVEALEILLGTGVTVNGLGICRRVGFKVAGVEFEADYISLDLGSADIILGVRWLSTLGKCQMDWSTHELAFKYKDRCVTFCGDPSLHGTKLSLKTLETKYEKQLRKKDYGITLHSHIVDEKITTPPSLKLILQKYEDLFEVPTQLPPVRNREHAINLTHGTNPITVRPYRYPHAQKEEMEKLVKQMPEAGIIRPSHSPYSSPVLLVNKKDDSWRFCVDYRALNRATIPDKFPIPVIDPTWSSSVFEA